MSNMTFYFPSAEVDKDSNKSTQADSLGSSATRTFFRQETSTDSPSILLTRLTASHDQVLFEMDTSKRTVEIG